MSVEKNICVSVLDKISKNGLLVSSNEDEVTEKQVKDLRVKVANVKQKISSLSGGNQQKAMVGKWLAIGPKILFMDEPTRGIDVGAKSEIYRLISDFVKEGMPCIVISSEIPEIQALCDRVVVMSEGRVTAVLDREQLKDANEIMRHAII